MTVFELVKNKETKEPASEEAGKVLEMTREQGLIFDKGGPNDNIFRILPPLCINRGDIDYMCDRLEEILTKM